MLGKKTLIGSKCILFHLDFVYYFYELQDDIYLEWFTSEVKMMFPDAFSGTTPFNHKVSQTLLRSQS
jgi:hypothetical protein